MNTFDLTVITLLLATASVPTVKASTQGVGVQNQASAPCTQKNNPSRNTIFVQRHILQQSFDTNSLEAWERYLKGRKLWCRHEVQSFMESREQVNNICTGGRRLNNGGNLCVSNAPMRIYDVTTWMQNRCIVNVEDRVARVVVACNRIGKTCLPVHFQASRNPVASNLPCWSR